MRIKYFTDKTKAAIEYDAQVQSGLKCLLSGPNDYVVAPNADGTTSYNYNAGGAGGIYVLLMDVPDTVASFDVQKSVAQATTGTGNQAVNP